MFEDFREGESGARYETDLCIIGAGAAGIAIAKEFVGTSTRVLVLESGSLGIESEVQALYQGENVGLPYFNLDVTRLRFFGGTTNHWGGRCAPMNDIDFRERPWVPHSGWPMTKQDLLPFYVRAQEVCGLGEYGYDESVWDRLGIERPPFDPRKIRTQFWQFSTPVARFGQRYRAALEESSNITVLMHANVTNIQTDEGAHHVTHLDIATLTGVQGRVRAKIYVLACGGIENPRMLLLSNQVQPQGLGNDHDLVGRFFMEHPRGRSGVVITENPYDLLEMYREHYPADDVPYWATWRCGETTQEREGILNTSLALYYDPAAGSGMEVLSNVRGQSNGRPWWNGLGKKVWRVVRDMDALGANTYRRYVRGKAMILNPGVIYLKARAEQSPNPDSRITLAREKDALGLSRINLNWQLSPLDKHSVAVSTRVLGEEFGRLGIGRIRLADWMLDGSPDWEDDLVGGHHHMGTTRMSDTPAKGVVDGNCRVHGNDNLYIAGSSVFATSGWANPTLTIVALALRLSDHVKTRLGARITADERVGVRLGASLPG